MPDHDSANKLDRAVARALSERDKRARGYRAVLVNGELTLENDREVASTSGRLLRHGGEVPIQ